MKLIIAEKPSLARNIAAALGVNTRQDGFLSGKDYLVTWAFGHLFSLADIEDYQPGREDGRWSMDNLPCFPKEFRFSLRRGADKQVDAGVERQFATIRALCNRPDVDAIVNAGDADREGEIIVRLCISHALETKKPLLRLWLPDQTPETIRAAAADMKPEEEYENLASEGFARTYIDWLYGVNLTRYATLKTGSLLRVGRVIVPIVKAIYDRDMAIKNFKPETYYSIASRAETNGEVVELNSKLRFSEKEKGRADKAAAFYNSVGAKVVSVKNKKDSLSPGKLYSLSKLQNLLGKKYKMSMQESLDIVQRLYEKGFLTYPRTNSEYLATAEKGKVKDILANVAKLGYPVELKESKTIFDDSKIESHSALTPTYRIPGKDALDEKERLVYSTVFRRFVAVFCSKPCVCVKSEIKIAVDKWEEFTLRGTVILEKGWTQYDDATTKDKVLPKLEKGDDVNVDFKPIEKQTTPPRHYTIETLNNYLKNPFKEEKAEAAKEAHDEAGENDAEDYRAIFEGLELGTEATRTGIIDNARKSEYIRLEKDVYTLLPGGAFLIESLLRMQISMDKYKTSELGQALKKVYRGEITVEDSVQLAAREIEAVFKEDAQPPEKDTDIGFFGEDVGTCPLCSGRVRRTVFGYGCANYKENGCRFSVRMSICNRVISPANMRLLLNSGKTAKIEGFVGKSGKQFDAALRLEDGRAVFDFT
ncbi:MAG: topoisomerase C-terminal repeat-containing protein [Clostridia bacterium]|nr:topoisomerase C-terminal repeat-containing protein [Clostridia bacterium]